MYCTFLEVITGDTSIRKELCTEFQTPGINGGNILAHLIYGSSTILCVPLFSKNLLMVSCVIRDRHFLQILSFLVGLNGNEWSGWGMGIAVILFTVCNFFIQHQV